MIQFRPFQTPTDWKWFRIYNPIIVGNDAKGILATNNGSPVAGCVMDYWRDSCVQIHQVILNPFVIRSGWLDVLGEAIVGEGRSTAYSFVPESNTKALKFNKHLGFKETGRVKDGWEVGVDYILLTIDREAWEKSDGRRRARRQVC